MVSSHEARIMDAVASEPLGMTASVIYTAVMSPLSFDIFRQILDIMVKEGRLRKIGMTYHDRRWK